MSDEAKTIKYDDPEKLDVGTFLRDMLREMLLADNDTITMNVEIKNPTGGNAQVKFTIKIEEVTA